MCIPINEPCHFLHIKMIVTTHLQGGLTPEEQLELGGLVLEATHLQGGLIHRRADHHAGRVLEATHLQGGLIV